MSNQKIQVKKAKDVYLEIEKYKFPNGLKEKCFESGLFQSDDDYYLSEGECKKWLSLCIANKGNSLSMQSLKVDEVWHNFILFTMDYHSFCKKFNSGNYIHHVPNVKKVNNNPKSNDFNRLYTESFGEMPNIWGNGADCVKADCNDGPPTFCKLE